MVDSKERRRPNQTAWSRAREPNCCQCSVLLPLIAAPPIPWANTWICPSQTRPSSPTPAPHTLPSSPCAFPPTALPAASTAVLATSPAMPSLSPQPGVVQRQCAVPAGVPRAAFLYELQWVLLDMHPPFHGRATLLTPGPQASPYWLHRHAARSALLHPCPRANARAGSPLHQKMA